MALRTGAILKQRYRITGRLGRGGFGAVYLAHDETLGREVAVKENLNADAGAGRQFEREAKLLASLDHTSLPKVIDYFHIVGRGQYLVMQYIAGEDLADRLEKRGPLPEAELLPWIGQIASALSYLHGQQPPVIHRDIKPANIRLSGKGSKATAMLVDFGLAKEFDPGLRTTIGARAITPGYSPPEQYGQTTTDARSDIYALGATLYHLLTDHEPAESTMRLIRETLRPARVVNPAVSPRVSDAVEQAMALDPALRFQSVRAFADALGITPPPKEQAGPPLAGERREVVAEPAGAYTLAESIAAPAEAAIAVPATEKAPPRPDSAARRSSRRKRETPWLIILVALAVLAAMLAAVFIVQNLWLETPPATSTPLAEVAPTSAATAAPLPSATPTKMPSPTPPPTATNLPTALPSPTIASTLPASPTPDPTIVSQIAATDVAATALAETLSTAAGLSNAVLPGSARDILLSENGDGELYQGYEHSDFQLIMSFEQLHRDYEEWTVGAIMRYDLPGAAGGSSEALVGLAFNVSSTGQWRLSTPDAQGQGGDLGFDPAATEALTIEIVGQGERGWLFVNNRFVSELDLSAGPNSGTLWLFADVPDAPAGESVTLLLTFRS